MRVKKCLQGYLSQILGVENELMVDAKTVETRELSDVPAAKP